MKKTIIAVFTTILLGAGGTSLNGQATTQSSNNVKKLALFVKPEITRPPEIFYLGGAAAFGAIGGAIGTIADKEPKEQLRLVLEREKIDISEIVYKEIILQVKQIDRFELLETPGNSFLVFAEIKLYGFNKRNAFSKTSYPTIKIKMSCQNDKGKIIWKDTDLVSPYASSDDQGFTLESWLTDPEKMRSGLVRVTQISVSQLVKSMLKELGN